MQYNFKFIDLFAGIGGFHLACHNLGGECVFASEWDKHARETYTANFKDISPSLFDENGKPTKNFAGDITKVDEKDIPDFDILCAGFPCQAFSIAGKRKGFEDARGTLFFDVARIIKEKQPSAFLLENVKGLLNHDNGRTFEVIKNTIENDLGYKLYYKVLNARDYGVPQNRERIMLVGFKNNSTEFEFPKPFKEKVKVGDVLENDVPEKYTISDKLWEYLQKRKEAQKAKGNGFGYSLFTENSEYCSTISARYGKDGSEVLIKQEGKNPRKLTPRECARMQGFPDNFKLVCSDTQTYKQMGNSVPTKMIEATVREILKVIAA